MSEELVGAVMDATAHGIAQVVLDVSADAAAEAAAQTQETEQQKEEVRFVVKGILICGLLFLFVAVCLILNHSKQKENTEYQEDSQWQVDPALK